MPPKTVLTHPSRLPDGFRLRSGFLAVDESARLFAELVEAAAWEQPDVRQPYTGKMSPQKRLSAYYGEPGDPYRYSGVTHSAMPWLPCLANLRVRVEEAVELPLTRALLFYYRFGGDRVAYHTDTYDGPPDRHVIAVVTVGTARRLQLRPRGAKRTTYSVELGPGSLFVMRRSAASDWEHQVPDTKKAVGPRIAISFRGGNY